jgi:hypothetical protein
MLFSISWKGSSRRRRLFLVPQISHKACTRLRVFSEIVAGLRSRAFTVSCFVQLSSEQFYCLATSRSALYPGISNLLRSHIVIEWRRCLMFPDLRMAPVAPRCGKDALSSSIVMALCHVQMAGRLYIVSQTSLFHCKTANQNRSPHRRYG